jgi:DNA-binding SARP family transcriptional activator
LPGKGCANAYGVMGVRFGVLGAVEVWLDGRPLQVGSDRERFVLATLLLNADRVFSADALIDALWPRPPRSAKTQLQNMISNLRRRLRSPEGDLILTRSRGYELSLAGRSLDVADFRRLAAGGRVAAASGDQELAERCYSEALALWRGPALSGTPDDLVAETRAALHEERLTVAENLFEVQWGLSRHDELLRSVPPFLVEHPYRERLHATWMRTLVGVGRRRDALAHYRQVHQTFVDELGIEPGEPLRCLETRILRGETVTAGAAPVRVVPRQLPPNARLTGRTELLDDIGQALTDGDHRVCVLVGPGGIGKTALALAAGELVACPDGQLYANLRDADPHAVIGRFLRAVGVDGAAIPDDADERIALYRSQFADRRALLVLDDAGHEGQVRPLLLPAGRCRTVVTSRHQLGALVDVARWTVPVLADHDAAALLAAKAGAGRISAEPVAAAEIVRLCGNLPLALSIAAARLAANRHWTVEDLRARLAREHGRLDELSVGDLDARANIGLSYAALTPAARRLLRRLGLTVASSWPEWIVEPLAGEPAGRELDQLVEVHLVEPAGRDAAGQQRYRLHDLVADYAAERALAEDDDSERSDAVERELKGWLALATVAGERLPHDDVRGLPCHPATAPPGAVALAANSPSAWFESDRRELVRAVDRAVALDRPELAGLLALRVSGFLGLRGYNNDRERVLRTAIRAVRRTDDQRLLSRLLAALFTACLRRDDHGALTAIAEEQLELASDRADRVLALTNAGRAANRLNRFREAIELLARAVPLARHADVPDGFLHGALAALAANYLYVGRPHEAVPLHEEAIGSRGRSELRTALTLYHLGVARTRTGQLDGAVAALTEARDLSGNLGDEELWAYTEQALADVDIQLGRLSSAEGRLSRARDIHTRLGVGDGLAETLRSTGDLAAVHGRHDEAIATLDQAVAVWQGIDSTFEIANTLARLERLHRAAGRTGTARACRAEYENLLREMDLDETSLYLPPQYT